MRGTFGLKLQIARNCLTYMLEFIVMQMRKANREKGYYPHNPPTAYLRSQNTIAIGVFMETSSRERAQPP